MVARDDRFDVEPMSVHFRASASECHEVGDERELMGSEGRKTPVTFVACLGPESAPVACGPERALAVGSRCC